MHKALKSPQKGDVDSDLDIDSDDLAQLIYHVGSNL
jgi:hypothetical protein